MQLKKMYRFKEVIMTNNFSENLRNQNFFPDSDILKSERVIKLKARFSIIIIWVSASAIGLLLFLFTLFIEPSPSTSKADFLLDKALNDWSSSKDQHGTNTVGNENENNDAFVFVNINKQFFLTRYPSTMDDAEKVTHNNKHPQASFETKPIIRIRRKNTNNKANSASDFSIKPVFQ
jgi:hypothetical protein